MRLKNYLSSSYFVANQTLQALVNDLAVIYYVYEDTKFTDTMPTSELWSFWSL